jgi:hypothetical protein
MVPASTRRNGQGAGLKILAMKVAVKVVAAAGACAGCRQRVGDGMMTPT